MRPGAKYRLRLFQKRACPQTGPNFLADVHGSEGLIAAPPWTLAYIKSSKGGRVNRALTPPRFRLSAYWPKAAEDRRKRQRLYWIFKVKIKEKH